MGSKEIVTIISSLSGIFQYSIKNGNELVTVSQELEQVKKYISIQEICYPDTFTIDYMLDERTLNAKCPKLILQPLVENAILHGFSKAGIYGHITISSTIADNSVIISIRDNGIGADAHQLNLYLEEKLDLPFKTSRYGIKNVNQRIILHFGKEYGLRFSSNKDHGLTAIVKLPLQI